MEKCWLIRTKNRQILGPVSKQKILEFVKKGSLAPDDEIASGNGYWFSIKETILIDKYLNGDIPQGFNPVSEAANVLTNSENQGNELTGSLNPNTMPQKESSPTAPVVENVDVQQIPEGEDSDYPDMGSSSDGQPSKEDLEYPDMGDLEYPSMDEPAAPVSAAPKIENSTPPSANASVSPTAPAHVELQEPGHNEEGKLPEGDDLDYPDMGMDSGAAQEVDEDATDPGFDFSVSEPPATPEVGEALGEKTQDEIIFSEAPQVKEDVTPDLPPPAVEAKEQPSKKKNKKPLTKSKKKKNKAQRNDKFLLYVLVILIGVIIFGAYYYFTKVLNSDISKIENPFFHSVHAQAESKTLSKKKTLLS